MLRSVIVGVDYIIGNGNKKRPKICKLAICDGVKRNLSNLIGVTECGYVL